MTRLIAAALILALMLPTAGATKAPACYLTGNARKQACMCGRVAVPLWVCKAKR